MQMSNWVVTVIDLDMRTKNRAHQSMFLRQKNLSSKWRREPIISPRCLCWDKPASWCELYGWSRRDLSLSWTWLWRNPSLGAEPWTYSHTRDIRSNIKTAFTTSPTVLESYSTSQRKSGWVEHAASIFLQHSCVFVLNPLTRLVWAGLKLSFYTTC